MSFDGQPAVSDVCPLTRTSKRQTVEHSIMSGALWVFHPFKQKAIIKSHQLVCFTKKLLLSDKSLVSSPLRIFQLS